MKNLSLDDAEPKKNVNFDGNVKDANTASSRRRRKVGTPKDDDKTSRGPATISAEKEPVSRTPSNKTGPSSLSRAARGVRLEEKLGSAGGARPDSMKKTNDPVSSQRRRSTQRRESSRQADTHLNEPSAKPRSVSTPYSGLKLDDDGELGWTKVTSPGRRRTNHDSTARPVRILRTSSSSKTGDDKTPSTSKRQSGSSRAGAPPRRGRASGTPRSS